MNTATKPSYYGAFFWVSLISFAVPLVVAMAAFRDITPTTKPTPAPDASGVDHNLWDYLLKTYVADGLIDYDGIAKDYLFRTYLRQLGECDFSKLTTTSDRLALMCNAYNAFVINGVIIHKVEQSVLDFKQDGVGFFDVKEHILGGTTISLNHLEHNVIRKAFAEPRIHVALVCAARSCPSIRPEAYVGTRIERQLADQASLFANNTKYVRWDESDTSIHLNPILQWYGEDWTSDGGYLAWLAELAEDGALADALQRAAGGEVAVQWNTYDWTLNSQREPGTHAAGPGGGAAFGSGSVPNE